MEKAAGQKVKKKRNVNKEEKHKMKGGRRGGTGLNSGIFHV